MLKERRRAPRAHGEEIELKIYYHDGRTLLGYGRLINVSTHGIGFYSEKIFDSGERLILEFTLWGKFRFLLIGRIIWVKKEEKDYRYGMEFIRIEPVEEVRLRKYVHSSLEKVVKYRI